jgi:fused-like protein
MGNIADPVQIATIHVVSILINPVYGDVFSFPWNRGPHDAINEYLEAVPMLEDSRNILSQIICDTELMKFLLTAFHSEDESQHIETKVAVLRIVTQMLRTPRDT